MSKLINESLLVVDSLSVKDTTQKYILEEVSFSLPPSSITAILGKSGAGKTILARSLLNLLPESFTYASGTIRFKNECYFGQSSNKLSLLRGAELAFVFQEAVSYLNPVFKTGRQFVDILQTFISQPKDKLTVKILSAFQDVNLTECEKVFNLYPHQLSSGMAQRAMLALALALEPKILILDEPTSALDPITSGKIVELLLDIRRKKNLTYLLITHDIHLANSIADQILSLEEGHLKKADISRSFSVSEMF